MTLRTLSALLAFVAASSLVVAYADEADPKTSDAKVEKAVDAKKAGDAEKAPKLTVGTDIGNRIPHFKIDAWSFAGEEPAKSSHDSHALERTTAYVFMSRTCPYCTMYQGRLAALAKAYKEKGVDFVMVYPTRATPQEQKVAYHKGAGFHAAFVNDAKASIAGALKIKKTPEVVLVNKHGEIVFRGGIDDKPRKAAAATQHFLKNAIEDVLAGRKVKVTRSRLFG